MILKTQKARIEVFILFITLGLVSLIALLYRLEIHTLQLSRLRKANHLRETIQRNELIAKLSTTDRLPINSNRALHFIHIDDEKNKAGMLISNQEIPNWSYLQNSQNKQLCNTECRYQDQSKTKSTHYNANYSAKRLTLFGKGTAKQELRVSVSGKISIEELILENFVDSSVEILSMEDLEVATMVVKKARGLNVLLHSSLGVARVKQSNILGCSKHLPNKQVFSTDKIRCQGVRNNIIWPRSRILGESKEKIYTNAIRKGVNE